MEMGTDHDSLSQEIKEFEILAIESLPISDAILETIVREQIADEQISLVRKYILEGWPQEIDDSLSHYFKVRSELSVVGNMLIFHNRIVIPTAMKSDMLKRIHDDGHLSLNKCRKRAQQCVWWPYISKELGNYIDRCSFCQINKKRNRCEPLKSTKLPDRPW